MTITSAETWILRFPSNRAAAERSDEFFELIGVTVHDDSGEHGTGWTFTSDYGGGESIKALLDVLLVQRLKGRSAHEVEAISGELWGLTSRLGRGITSLAIAAIDIALWDLRARLGKLSLAQILGQVRATVPAYGSGKASPTLPLKDLVELSVGYAEEGFKAIKLRVGREPDKDVERVTAVRKAIGPSVRIMCDANERLNLPTALRLGQKLAEFEVFWFEEPLPTSDLEGYRRLRTSLPLAIALGEHVFSRTDFTPYITSGAIDVIQPDICMVGGVTEIMRIGRMAESHGLTVAPHFMTELHIHIAAALPRAAYVEYYPFMDDLLIEKLKVKNGEIIVPTDPGHGVEFTPETWKKYRVA